MPPAVVSHVVALALLGGLASCASRPVEVDRPPDHELLALETRPPGHSLEYAWTITVTNRPAWGDARNRYTVWLPRTTRELAVRARYYDRAGRKRAEAYHFWGALAVIPYTWPFFLAAGADLASQGHECEAVLPLTEPVSARYLVTVDWSGPETTARASLLRQGADAEVVARVPCTVDGVAMPREEPKASAESAPR